MAINNKVKIFLLTVVSAFTFVCFVATNYSIVVSADSLVYRMYDPYSGEHFYTLSANERSFLVQKGWNYEGIGWTAPDSGDPVYRLYNRKTSEHLYTTSLLEKNVLSAGDWNYEGIGWYSSGSAPIYRAYNKFLPPRASHHFTASGHEQKTNVTYYRWSDEGIGWYGVSAGNPVPNFTLPGVSESQKNWLYQIAPTISTIGIQNNLYPSVILSQAITESAWGTSDLAVNANNYFGIKATPDWKGQIYTKVTSEYQNGQYVQVKADFRKYNSVDECINDYVNKMKTTMNGPNLRYRNVFRDQAATYAIAAQNLQADGYATSPTYAADLIARIQKYSLYLAD